MNYTRTSRYLPGCDGTRLAVDLYRPDVQGKVPLLLKAGNSPRRRMFEGDEEAVLRFLEAGVCGGLCGSPGRGGILWGV